MGKIYNTGFIGCGNISHFHADVLKRLNVNIVAVSYRSNRDKAELFRKKYGPLNIYSDWRLMLESEQLDFVWVTASWDIIDDLLLPVMNYNLPVFFEKPVALSSKKIRMCMELFPEGIKRVQIGYNRRFYKVVKELKQILLNKKIINIEVFIPESVNISETKLIKYRTLQNSSHIFDLLFYLIGDFDLKLKYLYKCSNIGASTHGFTTILETGDNYSVYVSSIFDSPQNTGIRIYTDDQYIYELKPIEKLSVYKGFEVIEPGRDQPIRLYNPKIVHISYEPNDGFKPGFFDQAFQFLDKTIHKKNKDFPNLDSSLKVTTIIENLI